MYQLAILYKRFYINGIYGEILKENHDEYSIKHGLAQNGSRSADI